MKIDSSYKSNLAPLGGRTPAPATAADARASGDSVNLSSIASALQGQMPPINSARIQEIKEAIAQGRFTINPEAIADGLIESARDLINQQRRGG